MQKAKPGFPSLAFNGTEPLKVEEVQMDLTKPSCGNFRKFVFGALRVLRLVLLLIEVLKQLRDFWF